jgi:hypothetical protein
MNEGARILRESENVGGKSPPRAGRPFTLEAKWLTTSDQAVPLRVVHGRDRVAGIHIFPVFDAGSEEMTTEAGK